MELLTYLLKVSACTVLFFAFYILVLRRLTFFKINRFYLLFTLLLSFIIPTLNFTIEREVETVAKVEAPMELQQEQYISPAVQLPMAVDENLEVIQEPFDWLMVLPYLYGSMVLVLISLAIWRLFQLLKHTKKGSQKINGLKVVSKTGGFTNCSFFNYVFIDESLTETELKILLKHEEVHAKQFHSIDKIILILAKAVLWFNPIVYLYDKALEQSHEYEADEATSQNFGTELYANLLLRLAISKSEMPLVHNFVKSPIKERIKMLFSSKSKHMKKLMYLLAIPIGLGLLWSFTVKVVEVSKSAKVSEIKLKGNGVSQNKTSKNDPLWNKTIRGKVKSILLTDVGEVLNFKHDKGVIRVLNLPKANVSVGDDVIITLGGGTTIDIKVFDAKGNLLKELDGPCYGMDMMKTLDGKILYDSNNRPFFSKGVVMQYGQYKTEKFTLHTISGKTPSAIIKHLSLTNEPSKVFIYVNGKLYSEKETLKFDQKFIASLSEKRGFAKAVDYDLPILTGKKNAYVFWFGKEPKAIPKTEKKNSSLVENHLKGNITDSRSNIKPVLLSSTSLTVDTKSDISYIKNGVMKFEDKIIEGNEMVYDKKNKTLLPSRLLLNLIMAM